MSDDPNVDESMVTSFPVVLYKVSQDWINTLFNEFKQTVMSKALENDCSKDFLKNLNELNLDFSDESKIKVNISHHAAEKQEEVKIENPS